MKKKKFLNADSTIALLCTWLEKSISSNIIVLLFSLNNYLIFKYKKLCTYFKILLNMCVSHVLYFNIFFVIARRKLMNLNSYLIYHSFYIRLKQISRKCFSTRFFNNYFINCNTYLFKIIASRMYAFLQASQLMYFFTFYYNYHCKKSTVI